MGRWAMIASGVLIVLVGFVLGLFALEAAAKFYTRDAKVMRRVDERGHNGYYADLKHEQYMNRKEHEAKKTDVKSKEGK